MRLLPLLTAVCLALSACARPEVGAAAFSFTDAAGRTVKLSAASPRTVALMGSFAEAWTLAGGTLVGATEDAVSERGMDLSGAAIVGTVKHPNLESVLALSPDFVLLSADIAAHREAVKILERAGVPAALCKTETYEDYRALMELFCSITGRQDLYERNALAVGKRIQAALAAPSPAAGKTVLFLRAYGTGVAAKADSNMVCAMLEDFGLVNIAKSQGSLLEQLDWEYVLRVQPDYILAAPMGDEAAAQASLNRALAGLPLLAVEEGRCRMLPKELFHYKPNARWGEAYEYLQKILEA